MKLIQRNKNNIKMASVDKLKKSDNYNLTESCFRILGRSKNLQFARVYNKEYNAVTGSDNLVNLHKAT